MSSVGIDSVKVQAGVVEEDGGHLGVVQFEAEHQGSVTWCIEEITVSTGVTQYPHTLRPGSESSTAQVIFFGMPAMKYLQCLSQCWSLPVLIDSPV